MYELCIDTVGPFSRDDEGFMYIVVIINNFTRYVTLHRCKNTMARAAGTALFDHCCTYGVPKVIHTDNGSQYVYALVSTLTKLFKY
jgi:transposase InsO family protein